MLAHFIARPPGLERGEFYLGHTFRWASQLALVDKVYMWMLTPQVRAPRNAYG